MGGGGGLQLRALFLRFALFFVSVGVSFLRFETHVAVFVVSRLGLACGSLGGYVFWCLRVEGVVLELRAILQFWL